MLKLMRCNIARLPRENGVRISFLLALLYAVGLGAVAGIVLGVALCLLQQHFGLIEIPADTFLVKSYPVLLRGGDVAAVVLAFTAVIGTVTAITVRRAVRPSDVAAMRPERGD